jgi:hypothetical protein
MERKSMAGGAGMAEKSDPLQQPTEEGGEHTPEEAQQVVAEHGPAVETHTTHDHEAGMHTAHSIHADGHEHHSEHGSADEAHEHAKHLSEDGQQEEMGEQGEEPEYE